jgi:hypothetical protein
MAVFSFTTQEDIKHVGIKHELSRMIDRQSVDLEVLLTRQSPKVREISTEHRYV